MVLRRLRKGEWIAAAGGLLLLVTLFLPWFSGTGGDRSAWEALSVLDLLLAALGLGAIGYWALMASTGSTALPLAVNVILVAVSLVVTVILLVRTFVAQPGDDAETSLRLGAYLGTLATFAVLAGVWTALADDSSPTATVTLTPPQPVPPAGPDPS